LEPPAKVERLILLKLETGLVSLRKAKLGKWVRIPTRLRSPSLKLGENKTLIEYCKGPFGLWLFWISQIARFNNPVRKLPNIKYPITNINSPDRCCYNPPAPIIGVS